IPILKRSKTLIAIWFPSTTTDSESNGFIGERNSSSHRTDNQLDEVANPLLSESVVVFLKQMRCHAFWSGTGLADNDTLYAGERLQSGLDRGCIPRFTDQMHIGTSVDSEIDGQAIGAPLTHGV